MDRTSLIVTSSPLRQSSMSASSVTVVRTTSACAAAMRCAMARRMPRSGSAGPRLARAGGAGFGETLGGALDVGARDGAARTGRLHQVEIDIELARERADRRKHLQGARRCRRRRLGFARRLFLLAELADDGARVLALPVLGKFDEGRADFDQIALGPEQARDAAAPGGGDLDHRLVGFDRHERLIDHHAIALVDVPGDDFRLFESFAEIRQYELAHGRFLVSAEFADLAGCSDDARNRRDVALLEP